MSGRFNSLFFPHDENPQHFKALDGLRGLAVLMVLLSHSSNENMYLGSFLNFRNSGKMGVYLFFVLSAYLLDRQIALALIDGKANRLYWQNYFLRRFLRIIPLFFIALVIYGVLTKFSFKTTIDGVQDMLQHMLLLKGEQHFWSIPVEFKYYFISPLVLWFCHRWLKWHTATTLVLFSSMITASIVLGFACRLPDVSTLRYLPVFVVGTVISIFELLEGNLISRLLSQRIYNWIGISAMILILLTVPYYFELITGAKTGFSSPVLYFPYACAWAAVLSSAKYGHGILKQFFEFKPLRFLGTISFSAYLFHMIFLQWTSATNIQQQFKIYIFFLTTISFATISYLLVERPLSKVRISSSEQTSVTPNSSMKPENQTV